MFELPSDRPAIDLADLPAWSALGEFDRALVINVRSQGQWAALAASASLANCLRRPGMMDFTGPAAHWAQRLPLRSCDRLRHISSAPCLAPGVQGAMVIDYDARIAVSLQDADRAFFLRSAADASYFDAGASRTEHDWACELILSRHLRTAVSPTGKSVDLPVPPCDHASAWGWLKDTTRTLLLPGLEPFEILAVNHIDFPLHAPGWTLREATPASTRAPDLFTALAPCLNRAEIDAWKAWAQGRQRPLHGIARLAASCALDVALPAPAAPRSIPRV